VRTKVVQRLTQEFGEPQTQYKWSLSADGPYRPTVNVYVDETHVPPGMVKVWVFDPARTTREASVHIEVRSDSDLADLVARIKEHVARRDGTA
jgi:hypothetical protein